MCEEAQRVLQAREQEEVEEVDEAQAAQAAEPWGEVEGAEKATTAGKGSAWGRARESRLHTWVGRVLTVSSGWVLATSDGREAQQGQGAEQIGCITEPRGDRRHLWGQDWRSRNPRETDGACGDGTGRHGIPGGQMAPVGMGLESLQEQLLAWQPADCGLKSPNTKRAAQPPSNLGLAHRGILQRYGTKSPVPGPVGPVPQPYPFLQGQRLRQEAEDEQQVGGCEEQGKPGCHFQGQGGSKHRAQGEAQ